MVAAVSVSCSVCGIDRAARGGGPGAAPRAADRWRDGARLSGFGKARVSQLFAAGSVSRRQMSDLRGFLIKLRRRTPDAIIVQCFHLKYEPHVK